MEILFITAILFIVIMGSLVTGYVLGGANEGLPDASEYKNDFTWTYNTSGDTAIERNNQKNG